MPEKKAGVIIESNFKIPWKGRRLVMDLSGVLSDNEYLYVLAEVKRREGGKAVDFERLLASGSYEMVSRLAAGHGGRDTIIIPPFGSCDIPPHEVAQFYRKYYKAGVGCGDGL